MKCKKCGNDNIGSPKYCTHCGNDMKENISTSKSNIINEKTKKIAHSYNETYRTHTNMNDIRADIILFVLGLFSTNILTIIFSILAIKATSAASKATSSYETEKKKISANKHRTKALIFLFIGPFIMLIPAIIFSVIINITTNHINNYDNIDNEFILSENTIQIPILEEVNESEYSSLKIIANQTNIVTEGNGLYKEIDYFGNTIYTYKSGKNDYTNINNYIKFNDQIWRILSISETGTLKIISEDINSYYEDGVIKYNNIVFDDKSRYNEDGYCNTSYDGCNLWASITTGTKNFDNDYEYDFSKNKVTKNSKLFDYLNSGDYWNNTLTEESKQMIIEDYWYYGLNTLDSEDNMYNTSVKANVGLINEAEYIKTANETINDITMKIYGANTWITQEEIEIDNTRKAYTINPYHYTSEYSHNYVQGFSKEENFGFTSPNEENNIIRPVVNITNKVKVISGDGTKSNPYVIEL